MSAYDKLRAAIQALGLYRLGGQSAVAKELAAYGAGLELLEEHLEACRQAIFPALAGAEGLALWEDLLGLLPLPGATLEERRQVVLCRLATRPDDFGREGLLRSLRACGVECRITEQYLPETLHIEGVRLLGEYSSLAEVTRAAEAVFPAHLDIVFAVGALSWDLFEAKNLCWDDWDAEDFTWDYFDLNGDRLGQAAPAAQKGDEDHIQQQ